MRWLGLRLVFDVMSASVNLTSVSIVKLLWMNWVSMGCNVVSVKGDMPGPQQSMTWSLNSAKIPLHLEPVGLYRSDSRG